MKDALSRIYFDDLPVRLLGDESRPPLDRIVRAGGKSPNRVDVVVLTSPKDKAGYLLTPGEIIDRTVEPAKPIYLRSVPKKMQTPAPRAGSGTVVSRLGRDPADRQAGRDDRMRKRDGQEDVEHAQEDEGMKG